MCGRYRLTAVDRIRERLGLDDPDVELRPRYNIAPSQPVAIVRQFDGVKMLSLARWGLVPFWAKEPSIGYKMINARSETVMQKPAFKQSFLRRRCLIPADSFYEWMKDGARKRPFNIGMKDDSVFALTRPFLASAGASPTLEPLHRPRRLGANLSTPEAGRVIRALLANDPERRWTQRGLEEHFGELQHPFIPKPSLGLVNKVVRHLRDEAFIEVLKDGGFRLRDPLKLLYAWRDAYRFDRHERRNYFTALRAAQLREALYKIDLEAGGASAYAAFSAAELQAPHVRQAMTWIYVSREHIAQFEALTNSKTVDSGENVVVLIPDDLGVFYLGEREADGLMCCTNAVQTYVDLFHCGGRGVEAAEALVEQRLRPKLGSVQKWHQDEYSSRQTEAAKRVLVDVGSISRITRSAYTSRRKSAVMGNSNRLVRRRRVEKNNTSRFSTSRV